MNTTTAIKRPVGRPRVLTPQQERELLQLRRENLSLSALAKRFQVGHGTVVRTINRGEAS